MSGCRPALSHNFLSGPAVPSHTLSEPQVSPSSQSALVSHGLSACSPVSVFSPVSHCPFLQASPSPHSTSFWQVSPQLLLPPVFLLPDTHPGKPGGQSALSLH